MKKVILFVMTVILLSNVTYAFEQCDKVYPENTECRYVATATVHYGHVTHRDIKVIEDIIRYAVLDSRTRIKINVDYDADLSDIYFAHDEEPVAVPLDSTEMFDPWEK